MAFLTVHSTAVAFSIETVTEPSEREARVSKHSDKYCVHPDSLALPYLNLNVNSSSCKVLVVNIHKDTMCLNMNPLIMQTQDMTDNRDLSLILQLSDSLWLSSWCQSQSVPESGFKRFVPNGPSQHLRACKTGVFFTTQRALQSFHLHQAVFPWSCPGPSRPASPTHRPRCALHSSLSICVMDEQTELHRFHV